MGDERREQFVRLPWDVVDDVAVGRLSHEQAWILVTLARHAWWRTGRVEFTLAALKTWSRLPARTSQETLRRWLRELNERGDTLVDPEAGAGSRTWVGGFARDDFGLPVFEAQPDRQLPILGQVVDLHKRDVGFVELGGDLHKRDVAVVEVTSTTSDATSCSTSAPVAIETTQKLHTRDDHQIQTSDPAAAVSQVHEATGLFGASNAESDDETTAAADLEEPARESEVRRIIETLRDRDSRTIDQVLPKATALPRALLHDVVARHSDRMRTGRVRNAAGLFCWLLDLAHAELRARAAAEVNAELERWTLNDHALHDGTSYARGRHPWSVAEELLTRKLRRLGAGDHELPALLAAAHAAYQQAVEAAA